MGGMVLIGLVRLFNICFFVEEFIDYVKMKFCCDYLFSELYLLKYVYGLFDISCKCF